MADRDELAAVPVGPIVIVGNSVIGEALSTPLITRSNDTWPLTVVDSVWIG